MNAVAKHLVEAMSAMDIIDCHEHLGPEESRVGQPVDFFTLFSFAPYTGADLALAGMDGATYGKLFDRSLPLEQRWEMFAPYWDRIRWTSYSRSILAAVERFYGQPCISRSTCAAISTAMEKANKPGLFDAVLRRACGIRACINDTGSTDTASDLFAPLIRVLMNDVESWQGLSRPAFAPDAAIESLDDYLEAARRYILKSKQEGAVGLKTTSLDYGAPDRAAALSAFQRLRSNPRERLAPAHVFPNYLRSTPLRDYVVDELVAYAGEQDLVVSVHTGYWGDFRNLHPLHVIPLLQRHPEVRFDIFHLGYPWIRETLMLAKGFPNVWLNFCWTHMISQRAAVDALDEALDLVPTNKILAFGGDYGANVVELIYGHLTMARENIATVLARRIREGSMTESQALDLARQWFWDNPVELYRLSR